MPKAKKLPSGNYRVRVFDGYIYKDGVKKKKYKSFTAPTKREAERMAAQWTGEKVTDLTVHDAIDRYIRAKTNVLSPSTIRGYRQMQKKYFGLIETMKLSKLKTEDMQMFVSGLAQDVSAKTVKNVYGLLTAAIAMFAPDAHYHVALPKALKKKKTAPTNEDIRLLFKEANGDMKIVIALAAFGSMRRGEICALKYDDIDGCVVSVHADMVEDESNMLRYKELPKTDDSFRSVTLPPEVIDLIGKGEGFIITRTPNAVTHAFTRLRNRLGVNVRLHDLRHYYAAIGAVLGVPDNYVSTFGGWKQGSSVMKEVYQNVIPDEADRFTGIMTGHFSKIINFQKRA